MLKSRRIRGLLVDVVDCKCQVEDVERELRGFDAKRLRATEARSLLEATLHAQANGFVFDALDRQVAAIAWDAVDECIASARVDALAEVADLIARCCHNRVDNSIDERVRAAIKAMHTKSHDGGSQLPLVDVFIRIGGGGFGIDQRIRRAAATLISFSESLLLPRIILRT